MPIYEYQCTSCGHQLEALQKMSDDPLRDCPACKQPALKKKVSAVAFRLKGGGWYETDFKSGEKKNLAGDSADAGSKGESGAKDADKKTANESTSKTDQSSGKSSSAGSTSSAGSADG